MRVALNSPKLQLVPGEGAGERASSVRLSFPPPIDRGLRTVSTRLRFATDRTREMLSLRSTQRYLGFARSFERIRAWAETIRFASTPRTLNTSERSVFRIGSNRFVSAAWAEALISTNPRSRAMPAHSRAGLRPPRSGCFVPSSTIRLRVGGSAGGGQRNRISYDIRPVAGKRKPPEHAACATRLARFPLAPTEPSSDR